MSIVITFYPERSDKRGLRALLTELGFVPSAHLWDWPKGASHFRWFSDVHLQAVAPEGGLEGSVQVVQFDVLHIGAALGAGVDGPNLGEEFGPVVLAQLGHGAPRLQFVTREPELTRVRAMRLGKVHFPGPRGLRIHLKGTDSASPPTSARMSCCYHGAVRQARLNQSRPSASMCLPFRPLARSPRHHRGHGATALGVVYVDGEHKHTYTTAGSDCDLAIVDSTRFHSIRSRSDRIVWTEYHLLRKNCQHWAREIVKENP